jgi:high-affinity Fe2+/Pb2+ permease
MGRFLLAVVKTVLLVVLAGGAVIASFYFAYFLLFMIILGLVALIGWYFFNREPSVDWYKYEDS